MKCALLYCCIVPIDNNDKDMREKQQALKRKKNVHSLPHHSLSIPDKAQTSSNKLTVCLLTDRKQPQFNTDAHI